MVFIELIWGGLWIYDFLKLGPLLQICLSYLSIPLIPLEIPITDILNCLKLSQRSQVLCSLFPPHDYSFFCFILDNFYYYFIMVSDLVSVGVGAMSNLLLMTFSALCLGDYRFLSLEFLFWSLICLPCFSLNFLNLSLSAASNICISSVLVSVDWFPPSFYIVFLRFLYIIQLGWTSLYSWALFWNTVKLLGNCLIPLSLIFKVC